MYGCWKSKVNMRPSQYYIHGFHLWEELGCFDLQMKNVNYNGFDYGSSNTLKFDSHSILASFPLSSSPPNLFKKKKSE